MMTRPASILSIGALAIIHILLFFLLMPFTLQMDIPNWWYPLFGENTFSAISWMQISHSIAVILAAIPPAVIIILIYPHIKYRIAVLVASGLTLIIAYDVFRSILDFGMQDSIGFHISTVTDILKTIPIMIFVVFFVALFFHNNKKRNEIDLSLIHI